MPEGDAVRRTARRLDAALAGGTLVRAELRVPRFATVDLRGMQVLGTHVVGKHMLTRLVDDRREWTLHHHLRMDGSWWTGPPGGPGARGTRSGSGWRPRRRRRSGCGCTTSKSGRRGRRPTGSAIWGLTSWLRASIRTPLRRSSPRRPPAGGGLARSAARLRDGHDLGLGAGQRRGGRPLGDDLDRQRTGRVAVRRSGPGCCAPWTPRRGDPPRAPRVRADRAALPLAAGRRSEPDVWGWRRWPGRPTGVPAVRRPAREARAAVR